MSESQYIPDPDELEDDAAGEQDELYEHYSITADRGQSPLRLDKFLTIHMELSLIHISEPTRPY